RLVASRGSQPRSSVWMRTGIRFLLHCFGGRGVPHSNGAAGGIHLQADLNSDSPGSSSGTGGITITSINGIPQIPPSVSCTATPSVLWPPNSMPVSVTVSGTVTAGTQAIRPGGTTYAVIDEYGQIQPSGTITLGAEG